MKIAIPAMLGIAAALALSTAPAFAITHAEAQAQCKAEFGGAAGRHAAQSGVTRSQAIKHCIKQAMHGAKHK